MEHFFIDVLLMRISNKTINNRKMFGSITHDRSLPKELNMLSMVKPSAEYEKRLQEEKDVKKQAILTASFETYVMESKLFTLSRICTEFRTIGYNTNYLEKAKDVVYSVQDTAEVADMAVDAAVKMWENNAAVLNAARLTKDVKIEIDKLADTIDNIDFTTDISDIAKQSNDIWAKAFNARDAWNAMVNQYAQPAAGGRRRTRRKRTHRKRKNRKRTHRR
jgi:hypothetical protein